MNIGFIGTGHMGRSLALIIAKKRSDVLLLNNRTSQKAIDLKNEIGSSAFVCSYEEIFLKSDYIFIGVKPKDFDELMDKVSKYDNKKVLVTMIAGLSIEEIERKYNGPIIRILPNTPTLIGEGLTFVTYNNKVSSKERKDFEEIMSTTGKMIEIAEDKINLASVFSGSAPAYVDYFIDAMAEGASKLGLSKEEATMYILQMLKGTVLLDLESDKSPLELGKEVCSPGGSTIEGVNCLIKLGLYDMLYKASKATYDKNNNMK